MSRPRITDEIYGQWKARFLVIMTRLGRPQEAGDALNAFCVQALQGQSQHQTLEQFAIDYLRANYGDSRARHHESRQALEHAQPVDKAQLNQDSCDGVRQEIFTDANKLWAFARELSEREQIVIRMVASGRSYSEIGEAIGLSEPGAFGVWKRIRQALQARIRLKKTG